MSFRGDDRAAAVQVGAVILFGFLVIAVTTWQATVVPQENARVEYAHSQRVVDDMQDARNVVVSAPGETSLRSVGVEMAPSYPPRSIFVNPGPPSGTLRTVGTDDPDHAISVNNATATDEETADFWNGTPHARYPTGALEYEPGYNVFTGAPDTVYENTALYTVGGDGTVVDVTGQDVVDGTTVTLVALDGRLSRTTSDTYSVDFEALSAPSTSVAVTNASNGNVTVSFPSRRGAGWWNASLAESGELDEFGGHVVDVRGTSAGDFENVTIELEGDVTYTLRMAKVGVGSGADDPGKSYVVDVAGDGTSVRSGNTRQLVVEVRDRYSNPVSGVTVTVDDSDTDLVGGSLDATEATTGSDGRATFEFTGGSAGTATVVVNVSDDATPLDRELATFEVDVTGGSTAGGAYTVTWSNPDGQTGVDCDASGDTCTVDASQTTSVDLTAATAPTVVDTTIDFGLNTTAVGSLTPGEAQTDGAGEATTTFDVAANGTVQVFASGGGSSDVIELTVVNVGSGNAPPTASIDDVQDRTRCTGGGCSGDNPAEFRVDWSATDDSGIQSVTVELVDSTGTVVDSVSPPASGTSAAGQVTLSDPGGSGGDYTIRLTVTDVDGASDSESTTQTADGDDAT